MQRNWIESRQQLICSTHRAAATCNNVVGRSLLHSIRSVIISVYLAATIAADVAAAVAANVATAAV